MFRLLLPANELWDEEKEVFIRYGGKEIELEHSLYTVSLWEQRWQKPFISKKKLDKKELMYYIISCMCMTENVSKQDWLMLTTKNIADIQSYMSDIACATTVHPKPSKGRPVSNKPQTAELIYAQMFHFGIPMECEHWHFNRLLTLIAVCADMNTPPTKMTAKDMMDQQKNQNERMKAMFNSRG